MDSGDSDNEILAKFRPEPEANKMISLLQPASPIKLHVQPYMGPPSHNQSGIDEQTGYSNSPKFSVYRLNNQSHLHQTPQHVTTFDDQLNHLNSQHRDIQDVGGLQRFDEPSRLYDIQNDYYQGGVKMV